MGTSSMKAEVGKTMGKRLFEYKDWILCESQTKSDRGLYATHLNCDNDDNDTGLAWLSEEPPVCWICNVKVPDEIQGIMHLYEWDNNG